MDHDAEINSLAAETLAIQSLLVHVFREIALSNPNLDFAIRRGFDGAANQSEYFAIKLGKSAPTEHAVKALGVIEELRTATFGKQKKPGG